MKSLILFSLFSVSAIAADYTIYPASMARSKGTISTQGVTALQSKDQSANQNEWSKYVEFTPATKYVGTFTFNLPSSVNKANIISYKLNTNYLGQAKLYQLWSFHLKNQKLGTFVKIGDTSSALGWYWSFMSYLFAGNADFVSTKNQIVVQYSSNNNYDASDLDFLSLVVTTKDVVDPTPTPTPTPSAWYKPTAGTKFAIQFVNLPIIDVPAAAVQVVDLYDTPQTSIDALKALGKKVVCYFSAGSYENWRSDATSFPTSVLGNNLSGWPGERWLDVRRIDLLGPIMTARMDLAVTKKCDGLDPDNMDGFANNSGFTLSYADQLAYNKFLAAEAHKRGLGIGLKNDLLQVADLVSDFDWSENEECFYYDECNYLLPFINQSKPVFQIEYNLNASSYCPQANKLKLSSIKKNLNLDGWVDMCSNYPTAP